MTKHRDPTPGIRVDRSRHRFQRQPRFVGVSGLPRAGSALLCQLLAQHPDIDCEGHSSPLCNTMPGIPRFARYPLAFIGICACFLDWRRVVCCPDSLPPIIRLPDIHRADQRLADGVNTGRQVTNRVGEGRGGKRLERFAGVASRTTGHGKIGNDPRAAACGSILERPKLRAASYCAASTG